MNKKHLLPALACLAFILIVSGCEEFQEYAGDCKDAGITYGYNLSNNLESFNVNAGPPLMIMDYVEFATQSFDNICLKYPMVIETRIEFTEQFPILLKVTTVVEGRTRSQDINMSTWTNQGANYLRLFNGDLLIDLSEHFAPDAPPKYGSVSFTFKLFWTSVSELSPLEEFNDHGGSIWMYFNYSQQKE
jgi:hypothetical protein